MSTPTTNMGLLIAVDGDNSRTYLTTSLGTSLTTLDTHDHALASNARGKPINTIPSGGLTITAGSLTLTAGNLSLTAGTIGIGTAAASNYGMRLGGSAVTVAGGAAFGIANTMTISAAANNDTIYTNYIGPSLNATSHTGVSVWGQYIAAMTPSNWGQANTSGYGQQIVAPTGAAVDNINLYLSGTPSGGTRNLSLKADSAIAITVGGGTIATAGNIRLPNAQYVAWRNAANSGDHSVGFNSSDEFLIGGVGVAASATAGSNGATPLQVVGYIKVVLSGTSYKVPYYNT